jgi:para-nitrobenzyl esterase
VAGAAAGVPQTAFGTPCLPERPADRLREGRVHPVPVIRGGTRDEHRAWASFLTLQTAITAENLPTLIEQAFGARDADVAALYPIGEEGALGAWSAIGGDCAWALPFFESFKGSARAAPTYAFEFADETAPNPAFPMPAGFPLKAGHATDLLYLFDFAGMKARLDPRQAALSRAMIGYWSRFAATGDPNGPGLPDWRPFEDATSFVLSLAPGEGGVSPIDYAAEHHCAFWASLLTDLPTEEGNGP